MKFYNIFFFKYFFIFFLTIAFLPSCSHDKFKISGEINGGENQSLVLEKSDFQGRWLPIDSTKISKNGKFSISFPAPLAPEIFRLSLNNQYVYVPVDSTETISLTSSYNRFGSDFILEGSKNAELLTQFEKQLQNVDISNPDSLSNFKKSVFANFMKDFPGSVLNYYILTKSVNNNQLYNPNDRVDLKYFAAVATGFKSMRPNDPRSTLLEQTALQGLKQKNSDQGNYRQYEAEEIALIDMDLQDETGKNVKLSTLTGKGKPVVVIFSMLNLENSPELNIALANIYNQHKGNVEFYNVSLDADQFAWREAAKNLPWITVYSPGQTNSVDAVKYNVFQIPSFFIYNSKGELESRPMTLDELQKSLK